MGLEDQYPYIPVPRPGASDATRVISPPFGGLRTCLTRAHGTIIETTIVRDPGVNANYLHGARGNTPLQTLPPALWMLLLPLAITIMGPEGMPVCNQPSGPQHCSYCCQRLHCLWYSFPRQSLKTHPSCGPYSWHCQSHHQYLSHCGLR